MLAALLVAATAVWLLAVCLLLPEQQAAADPALIGGPFHLTNQHSQPVTNETYARRPMLIYFGYTFCPCVCPLGLKTMMAAYDDLP